MASDAKGKSKLDLNKIAAQLEGLEETIIFMLINRAQFAQNRVIYEPNASGFEGAGASSLFEMRLRRHEEMDAEFGRFFVPEERPFLKDLPSPKRAVNLPPSGLNVNDFDVINVTEKILEAYLGLIPQICIEGDDGQYGSSVEHDVIALQAIARRIHFGALYVSESKYQAEPEKYNAIRKTGDKEKLLAALTRVEVEERILARVADKVEHIQAQINPKTRRSVPPEAIMTFYRHHVIPLTKDGEILYFQNRISL